MAQGIAHARVHHVRCGAQRCGASLESLPGWAQLAPPARAAAQAQQPQQPGSALGTAVAFPLFLPRCEGVQATIGSSADGPPGGSDGGGGQSHAGAAGAAGSGRGAGPSAPQEETPQLHDKTLKHMDFWSGVRWDALHDGVRTSRVVPQPLRPAVADLRKALAAEIANQEGRPLEEACFKALWFMDRLLFATRRRGRGGRRGQHGETVARTIARRIRLAWAGEWCELWAESEDAVPSGAGPVPTEALRLAKDVQRIREALRDEDTRDAMRLVDGMAAMAPDAKARRCLPALFPQAPNQPAQPTTQPTPQDVERFMHELRNAYRFAPAHRGAGPGSALGEHWSWMPAESPEAFEAFAPIALRVALGRVPLGMLRAHLSARVLAEDRPNEDNVRPFALGNLHRRLASKATGRVFQARVAAALAPYEYSLGAKSGAESMHKAVLLDLDSRPSCVKVSFDCTNAHNEFSRDFAMGRIAALVPDLVPWVAAPLCTATCHIHRGSDGSRTELQKTRDGDQGDALTTLIFPISYRSVGAAVAQAAGTPEKQAHEYTYQDDLETVCDASAVEAAAVAFDSACAAAGLRANRTKMVATLGRTALAESLPRGLRVDPRGLVLKHGRPNPLPAVPAQAAEAGTSLPEHSPEVEHLRARRAAFFSRLAALRAAGLTALEGQSLARLRTSGDFTYVGRACGIPAADAAQLDQELVTCLVNLHGLRPEEVSSTIPKLFLLAGSDGGMGYHSVELAAPAAYAASWHACLPRVLLRLGLGSLAELVSASPLATRCVPFAAGTLRAALNDPTAELGDPEAQASQHMLASAPLAAARARVVADLAANPVAQAALRSAGGKGSAVWLQPPTEAAHGQTDAQFAISTRIRLGLPLPGCQGRCAHRRADGTVCGHLLDPLGVHARSCPSGGWLKHRHDAARDVLGDWCEEHGCRVEREAVLPFAAPARPEARIDLVVHVPGRGVPAHVDVSIVSALSVEALQKGSASQDGRAAEIAENSKRRDYPGIRVTPFVVEDHGRYGEEAAKFVRQVAPKEPAARSRAIRDLYHRLGALLQRKAADAVLAACCRLGHAGAS